MLVSWLLACILILATTASAQYISPVIVRWNFIHFQSHGFTLTRRINVAHLQASGKSFALNLGLLLPLNYPSANTLYYGHPGGLAFIQALDEINARTDILPNHRIVGWYNSSDGDIGKAVAVTVELVRERCLLHIDCIRVKIFLNGNTRPA